MLLSCSSALSSLKTLSMDLGKLRMYMSLKSYLLSASPIREILSVKYVRDITMYLTPTPKSPLFKSASAYSELRRRVIKTSHVALYHISTLLMSLGSPSVRIISSVDGVSGVIDDYGNVYELRSGAGVGFDDDVNDDAVITEEADGAVLREGIPRTRQRQGAASSYGVVKSEGRAQGSERERDYDRVTSPFPTYQSSSWSSSSPSGPSRSANPSGGGASLGCMINRATTYAVSKGGTIIKAGIEKISSSSSSSALQPSRAVDTSRAPSSPSSPSSTSSSSPTLNVGCSHFLTALTLLSSAVIKVCVKSGVSGEDMSAMDFVGNLVKLRERLGEELGLEGDV